MADEEKEEFEENQENTGGEQKRKKVPINLIIIAILALCLLGGGFYVWKSGLLSGDDSGEGSLDDQETVHEEMGPTYPLDTFIVNLVGGRGKNYLKARVELELDSDKTVAEIDKYLPKIKDAILTMMSSKSNEEISSLEGKYQLRAEIISTLNQFLKSGKVKNVYFTDFIVQ